MILDTLECVGVTVPATHQLRKLVDMTEKNGSACVVTEWIKKHISEITEWEAETRYNFDYFLELEFVQEGLREVEVFLTLNGLCMDFDPEITSEIKIEVLKLIPENEQNLSDFELNCYYHVFKKKLIKSGKI